MPPIIEPEIPAGGEAPVAFAGNANLAIEPFAANVVLVADVVCDDACCNAAKLGVMANAMTIAAITPRIAYVFITNAQAK